MTTTMPTTSQLHPRDLVGVAAIGLRTRRLRAALSALGIAIGIAAMVAVLGISQSSRADLLAQLDALGTNLLTVTPGETFLGEDAKLPKAAPGMIRRIG
ncbi:MAG TPA: ABC transporter permease, partial [Actinomycetota bacterium]|nr:ABC transporter permease [Actinomycetota bacterium]